MKLEQALEEYERKREKVLKEAEKIRKKHNKRLKKRVKELLKRIDELERKEIPKDVDGNIRKIVTAERRNYILALRNALASVEDMDSLGKRLPDLAKLHVGHGKYLLILFEKDVYAINRILKELNEEYVEYYNELTEKGLNDINVRETLKELSFTKREIDKVKDELNGLRKRLEEKREELEELYSKKRLKELEDEIKRRKLTLKGIETEVRSKASKLQKPVKRMRLGDAIGDELVRDSSVALRKPEEFLNFVRRIEPRLDNKGRKAAEWLENNLMESVERISKDGEELKEVEMRKEKILSRGKEIEEEIRSLEGEIGKREMELKKHRSRLEHLEKQLDGEISELERVLGVEIER